MDDLGALFRKARLAKGLTRDQVGDMIGMTGNGYGKIELGVNKISTDLVAPICRATGTSMLDVMAAMSGRLSDGDVQSFVPFGAMGCSVGFTSEEWRMHEALCRFAGISDMRSEEAYLVSKEAIAARRRNLVKIETEE